MLRKIRNIIGMFLSLTLIITNMAIITNSFAKTDDFEDTNSVEETNSMKERDLKEYISIKKKKCGNSKPSKVENLQVLNRIYNYIKIQWSQVKSDDGYTIFRSNMKNRVYEKVGEVDSKILSFIDENLKSGEKYYYKVRAFKELNGQICFGQYSHILCVYTKK